MKITVDEVWLEKKFTQSMWLGAAPGFVIGAVVMFLICHFRWDLIP